MSDGANWDWTDDPAAVTLPKDWRTSGWLEKQHMPEGCLALTDEEMLKIWRRTCAVRNQELDFFWSMNCAARSKEEEEWRESFRKKRQATRISTTVAPELSDAVRQLNNDVREMTGACREIDVALRQIEEWVSKNVKPRGKR